jgi:hypothetical protein
MRSRIPKTNIYLFQNLSSKAKLSRNRPKSKLSREQRREIRRKLVEPKIADINVTVVSQDIQLTTPDDLSQKVSILNATRTGKSKRKILFTKKSVYKKYKHRTKFTNPDNSPISNKPEFLKSQIGHFDKSEVVRIRAVYLSKDHDPFDCSVDLNPKTNQAITVREYVGYGVYVGPRILRKSEVERLLKHGVISHDQARFEDVSWIKHGMTAKDIMTHYNFSKKGKLNDDVMDSVEVAKQFSEIMKNQCSPGDDG